MKVHRCTYFWGRECSDLGVGGWVSCNPNVVRICKSVRNIGRSLSLINSLMIIKFIISHDFNAEIQLLSRENCFNLALYRLV